MIVYNFFRILPILLLFEAVLFSFCLDSKFAKFWWFVVLGIILNGLIWYIVGISIKKYDLALSKRPQTAHCAYIENNKLTVSGGLPSGHCQTMGFFATWFIIYIILNNFEWYIGAPMIGVLLWFIWFMMYSRVIYFRCHTWFQASTGSLIGSLVAIVLYVIYRWSM